MVVVALLPQMKDAELFPRDIFDTLLHKLYASAQIGSVGQASDN